LKQSFYIAVLLWLAAAQVLAQAPTHSAADPQRLAALSLEQQGKFQDAEDAWRAYSKVHPAAPEPYAHLGLLAARQERYPEAVILYRKALRINPKVPGLRFDLALALFKGGQLKEAAVEFKALLKTAPPGSPDVQKLNVLLGMCHYGLGHYAEAVPYLKEATAHDQQNLPLRLTLAHSCLWSKQMQCVMDVYHEILTLNAESAEADMLAGEALDDMRDRDGATKMFQAAVAANPKEPNAHYGLGYLLWAEKRYSDALPQFQAELEINPNDAKSLVYLGDCSLQLNNPTDARGPLQKGLALDPSLWIADLDLGIIDSDAGRNADALRELKKALELKPDEVNAHWRMAKLLRVMGRTEEAKAEFETAKQLNKKAAEDLHKQIANGRQRNHDDTQAPQTGATPEQ
jgi:tetratricopeptide (TPR) repeat protein